MLRRLGLSLALIAATASTGGAQQISGTTGLTGLTGGTFSTFDFTGVAANNGDAVTTQLLASGLTFDGAYLGLTFLYGPFGDAALYNYSFAQAFSSRITVGFSQARSGVAFNFATLPGPSIFQVWRNGSVVSAITPLVSQTGSSAAQLAAWWGFDFTDGTTFDMLTIDGTPNGFGIDNLEVRAVTTTVPEPSTIGLLTLGLVGIGLTARRRAARRRRLK